MDYIGISGLVISVAGFAVAIWQLKKTQAAAEAARDASRDAVNAIRHIEAVADIQAVCGRSRDLLHLTRARNLASAANAAFELRDAVSRYRYDLPAPALIPDDQWNRVLADVGTVHERLESASITNRLGADERERLIHEIARLHSQFSSLAAKAAKVGANNANP